MADVVRTSKFLSLVLRHKPRSIGLTLDKAGWVSVDVLLAALAERGRGIDRAFLERVVAENNKQRFEFSPDGTRIRARQGHSVEVELGYAPAEPPDVLYHGTALQFVEEIREKGLLPMSRHHVHMSPDLETATKVGSRHGKVVVLHVHTIGMVQRGVRFFHTDNNVWLVDHVPAACIGFPCTDCLRHEEPNELYMVRDEVWASAKAHPRDRLHIECLEKRLGRKLTEDDFSDVLLNYGRIPFERIERSYR